MSISGVVFCRSACFIHIAKKTKRQQKKNLTFFFLYKFINIDRQRHHRYGITILMIRGFFQARDSVRLASRIAIPAADRTMKEEEVKNHFVQS